MSVNLEDQVKSIAKDLGFEDCRFARAQKASHAEEFQDWLDDDKHGDMEWMAKNPERRKDPMGRPETLIPARARRIAFATVSKA